MFIPTGTNREGSRSPIVTPILVGANIAIYFVGITLAKRGSLDLERVYSIGALDWDTLRWWEPFTYQFLHDPGSIMHVLGNMIFLWAFGTVVESRLGWLGYLTLYLLGGAMAGLAQVLVTGGSAIGASGSTSVVAGAFLALHPRGVVHGWWLLPPMRVDMRASWLLGLYAAIDLVNTILDLSGLRCSRVGTIAHLVGLLVGLLTCVTLLGSGVLRRNDFDLFFLLKQWKRRRELREAAQSVGLGDPDKVAGRVASGAQGRESERHRTLRATIAAAHRERDYTLAAQLYEEITTDLPDATLPAEIQLDVANELARAGKHEMAVRAYRKFIERFRMHPSCDDARLMQAVLEARRLGDSSAAMATLDGVSGLGFDEARKSLYETLRAECAAKGQA